MSGSGISGLKKKRGVVGKLLCEKSGQGLEGVKKQLKKEKSSSGTKQRICLPWGEQRGISSSGGIGIESIPMENKIGALNRQISCLSKGKCLVDVSRESPGKVQRRKGSTSERVGPRQSKGPERRS